MTPAHTPTREEKETDLLFYTSVSLKGLISLAEVAAGLLFLLVPAEAIARGADRLSRMLPSALQSVPTHLLHAAAEFSGAGALFLAFYLFSRGLIKALLIFALLRSKLWAYPLSLAVLGAFLAYQLYQIATTGSRVVIGVTLFDLVVMFSIWREYRLARMRTGLAD